MIQKNKEIYVCVSVFTLKRLGYLKTGITAVSAPVGRRGEAGSGSPLHRGQPDRMRARQGPVAGLTSGMERGAHDLVLRGRAIRVGIRGVRRTGVIRVGVGVDDDDDGNFEGVLKGLRLAILINEINFLRHLARRGVNNGCGEGGRGRGRRGVTVGQRKLFEGCGLRIVIHEIQRSALDAGLVETEVGELGVDDARHNELG